MLLKMLERVLRYDPKSTDGKERLLASHVRWEIYEYPFL